MIYRLFKLIISSFVQHDHRFFHFIRVAIKPYFLSMPTTAVYGFPLPDQAVAVLLTVPRSLCWWWCGG